MTTAPNLPVEHEKSLTVQCKTGLMSKGGNQLKCMYGEIVPVDDPPLCDIIGTSRKLSNSFVEYILYYISISSRLMYLYSNHRYFFKLADNTKISP